MANAKAKTINLLLYDGNLNGVISIEDSNWNSGELFSAPRESVSDLIATEACKKYGVYLLLSENMVYIGQSSDLASRISNHIIGKDWWERVVILSTKDDNLTRTDIDYLEAVLINKAEEVGRLDSDNKKKGNKIKVDKFREVVLYQYLEEALFLMQLIGINVFSEVKKNSILNTVDSHTKLAIGKRAKKDAVNYLQDKGINVGKNVTYACKQENNNEFWANPQKKCLEEDWWLILNNNMKNELVVLFVPSNSLKVAYGKKKGILLRSDNDNKLDLNINADTLKDRRSKIDFSKYIINKIEY
ncbi:MAG: GIY-YIG nuclease family protein [Eubacterium sp.]|nr:GIY-YIG nuclease family protein [Eubacterium sp.]